MPPRRREALLKRKALADADAGFEQCRDCGKGGLSARGGLRRHQNSCLEYHQRLERQLDRVERQAGEHQVIREPHDDEIGEGKYKTFTAMKEEPKQSSDTHISTSTNHFEDDAFVPSGDDDFMDISGQNDAYNSQQHDAIDPVALSPRGFPSSLQNPLPLQTQPQPPRNSSSINRKCLYNLYHLYFNSHLLLGPNFPYVRIQYHPKSGAKDSYTPRDAYFSQKLSDHTRRTVDIDDGIPNKSIPPWVGFKSYADFTYAEFAFDCGLSNSQIDRSLDMGPTWYPGGTSEITFKSHRDLMEIRHNHFTSNASKVSHQHFLLRESQILSWNMTISSRSSTLHADTEIIRNRSQKRLLLSTCVTSWSGSANCYAIETYRGT